MENLEYKGYLGSVEYSEADRCFCGEVLGLTRDGIIYEGDTPAELMEGFKYMIDRYLAGCAEDGREPEKSQYVDVRLPLNVYEQIDAIADKAGINFGAYVNRRIGDN